MNSFRVDFDSDIFVTGSNTCLLFSEYATYLDLLRKIIMFLAGNIGNSTSITSISNTLVNEKLQILPVQAGLPADCHIQL